jgi:hypothetical protein
MNYDSTVDAKKHIKEIQIPNYLRIEDLEKRAKEHDQSKLHNPEKSGYFKYNVFYYSDYINKEK